MCIPYRYVKREYRQPRPNSMSPTSINIPKTHTDITRKNPTDTSYMEYLTKYYSIRKKSHTPIYTAQENMIPHTKLLLLKYIHQYLDILPYIRPGDTTDEKKCRSDRKVHPIRTPQNLYLVTPLEPIQRHCSN